MAKKVKEKDKEITKKDKNKKVDKKKNKKENIVEPKKKTIKKAKTKSYADNTKFEMSGQIKQVIITSLIVLCVLGIFYIIAFKKTGHTFFNHKDEEEETTFQYSEILLGTSFDMGGEYLVVYYDMNNEDDPDTSKITEEITNFTYMGGTKIYKCDIGSAFNKPFVTDGEPNTNPGSSEELLINGPTVIKFNDGVVSNYVYGTDEVVNYLKELRSN